MRPVVLHITASGVEGYCRECKRWYQLSKSLSLAALLLLSHDQGHEEAAAVAEAERIIQEGARA